MANKMKFYYKDLEFDTPTELAKHIGIDPTWLNTMLNRGKDLDELDIHNLKTRNSNKKVSIRGITYCSQAEVIRKFKIGSSLIDKKRKKYNLTFEDTMELLISFIEKYNIPMNMFLTSIPYAVVKTTRFDKLIDFCNYYGLYPTTYMTYKSAFKKKHTKATGVDFCKYLIECTNLDGDDKLREDLPNIIFTREAFDRHVQQFLLKNYSTKEE